jgi:hypothetical protein
MSGAPSPLVSPLMLVSGPVMAGSEFVGLMTEPIRLTAKVILSLPGWLFAY